MNEPMIVSTKKPPKLKFKTTSTIEDCVSCGKQEDHEVLSQESRNDKDKHDD